MELGKFFNLSGTKFWTQLEKILSIFTFLEMLLSSMQLLLTDKPVIPDSINTETIFALVVWLVDKSTTKGNTNTREIGWLVSFLPPSYTESFELL